MTSYPHQATENPHADNEIMAYPRHKDPFLEDDDDEYSFGGKGRQGAPYKTRTVTGGGGYSPWEEPKSDYSRPMSQAEQTQQLKENSMNNQLESTQRAIASIYDSERVGIATAEELVRQGEQLDNIERKTSNINADMKVTQRHLNSIKSVFGGIKNWWSGEKEKPKEQPQASSRPENTRLREALDGAERRPDVHPAMRVRGEDLSGFYEEQDDLDSKFMAGSARGGEAGMSQDSQRAALGMSSRQQQQQQERVTSFDRYDQQFNENIDVMSDGMARLKMMAMGLGDEIHAQNDQIEDRILPSVERADQNIRDQNRQMKRILGVKK